MAANGASSSSKHPGQRVVGELQPRSGSSVPRRAAGGSPARMCLHPQLHPGSCLRPHGGPESPCVSAPDPAGRGCGGFCGCRSGVSASPRPPGHRHPAPARPSAQSCGPGVTPQPLPSKLQLNKPRRILRLFLLRGGGFWGFFMAFGSLFHVLCLWHISSLPQTFEYYLPWSKQRQTFERSLLVPSGEHPS